MLEFESYKYQIKKKIDVSNADAFIFFTLKKLVITVLYFLLLPSFCLNEWKSGHFCASVQQLPSIWHIFIVLSKHLVAVKWDLVLLACENVYFTL